MHVGEAPPARETRARGIGGAYGSGIAAAPPPPPPPPPVIDGDFERRWPGRAAVMRHGRVVQDGAIDEVWREPVDEETALFLGYARVVRGEAAVRVLAAAGQPPAAAVALRRSALVASERGDGTIVARVDAARVTPEQVRLVVEAPGIGTLDAVAPLGSRVAPGDEVSLEVDVTRLAVLPIAPGS